MAEKSSAAIRAADWLDDGPTIEVEFVDVPDDDPKLLVNDDGASGLPIADVIDDDFKLELKISFVHFA